MSLAEAAVRRGVPWAALRPAAGGLAVGALALVTTGVLSSGHGALHLVLSTEMTARALLILLALKTVAAAVSIGAGFRGGLFFASLLLGALVGKLFALGVALAAPPGVDTMLFAVVGMSAFGAAVIGAPLATVFLALETTRDFAVGGPVLAAVAVSALAVRRLFGYSFATWRFHLRGEAIRSPHDVGWLRDLTVSKLMRRGEPTVRTDMRLSDFRREFSLGSATRVVAVDEAGRYAGMVSVVEAHAPEVDASETVAALLRLRDQALLPAMNAKGVMALFEAAEAEELAVVDGAETRRVIGLLSEKHLLRRYGEELDKRRHEEAGLAWGPGAGG
jgi:CIC family chloride channel protein